MTPKDDELPSNPPEILPIFNQTSDYEEPSDSSKRTENNPLKGIFPNKDHGVTVDTQPNDKGISLSDEQVVFDGISLSDEQGVLDATSPERASEKSIAPIYWEDDEFGMMLATESLNDDAFSDRAAADYSIKNISLEEDGEDLGFKIENPLDSADLNFYKTGNEYKISIGHDIKPPLSSEAKKAVLEEVRDELKAADPENAYQMGLKLARDSLIIHNPPEKVRKLLNEHIKNQQRHL